MSKTLLLSIFGCIIISSTKYSARIELCSGNNGVQWIKADMIPVVLGLSGNIFSMSATGFANALDVVVSDGTNLFHTHRTPTMWSALINLRAMIQPNFSGPLQVPACAIVGGNLHICATSNGSIMHAIRLANGTFHNPESSPGSVFGDVTGTVLTGANGSIPPRSFSQIACAGDPF